MSKARFTFGELVCAVAAGAIAIAYLFFTLLLFGKCTCSGPVQVDSGEVAVTVMQWGFATIGIWVLWVGVLTLRKRNR